VLHTWGQNLHHHPHVHCIVPGGGLSPDAKRWVACRPGFFLPVRVLASRFRRRFLDRINAAFKTGRLRFFQALAPLADPAIFAQRLAALRRRDWVVYAKLPFGGPEHVLAYLGRYTHRVAIANSRLIKLQDGRVSFRWRDYRHGAHSKVMTLTAEEFMRRFLLHALPDGFQRIRHYGFLANGHRADRLTVPTLARRAAPRTASAHPRLSPTLSSAHRTRPRHLSLLRRHHGAHRRVAAPDPARRNSVLVRHLMIHARHTRYARFRPPTPRRSGQRTINLVRPASQDDQTAAGATEPAPLATMFAATRRRALPPPVPVPPARHTSPAPPTPAKTPQSP
jgi:hypothetical protein